MLKRITFVVLLLGLLTSLVSYGCCGKCNVSKTKAITHDCEGCDQDKCISEKTDKTDKDYSEGDCPSKTDEAACKGCGKEKCECPDHSNASTKLPGATMGVVFTAETLYNCPMHPDVVTENADLPCPVCKMKLSKMSDEKVDALKKSEPKGCVMCPIVVNGNSETAECMTCKMNLVEIKSSSNL